MWVSLTGMVGQYGPEYAVGYSGDTDPHSGDVDPLYGFGSVKLMA